MDIASLIGFIGAMGMIMGAMISGGGVGPFIDTPSHSIALNCGWWNLFFGNVHLPFTSFSWKFWRYGKGVPSTSQKNGSVG